MRLENANCFFQGWQLACANTRKEGENMMPLTLTDVGQEQIVRRIGGNDEVRRHLENLGFVAGSAVTLISALGGNVIVKVKESRVAISAEMARKIMV